MMRMMKWRSIGLMLLLLLAMTTVVASADVISQGMITPTQMLESEPLNMDRSSYYVFDAEEGGIFGGNIMNNVANLILGLHKAVVSFVISIVVFCYEVHIFQLFKELLVDIMYPLKVSLYDQFFGFGVAITLVTLFVIYSAGQSAGFIQAIFKFAIVLFFAAVFLNNPAVVLDETDQVITEFNTSIVNNSFAVVYGKKGDGEMLAAIADQMWDQYVDQPWTMIEFGTVNPGPAKNEILSLEPGSKERKAKTKELAASNRAFKKDNAWERIPSIFIFSFLSVVCLALDMVLAAINIGFDGAVLLMAVYAPVVLTLSLIPFYGPKAIETWIRNIVAFLVLRVVVVVVLTVKFVMNAYFFTKAGRYGVIGVIMIQLFIYAALFFNRKKLLNMVDGAKYGHRGINRAMDRDGDIIGQAKGDYRSARDFGGAVQRFSNRFSWGGLEPAFDTDGGESFRDRRGRGWADDAGSDMDQPQRQFSSRSRDKNIAMDYLQQRYQHEKESAEARARQLSERKGRTVEPEYSDFVAEHLHTERMGGEVFTRAEINDTIRELNHIRSMGGSEADMFRQLQDDKKYRSDVAAPERIDMNLSRTMSVHLDDQAAVYLKRQFELHKTTADTYAREKAASSNRSVSPEYDVFTETVQERMRKGHNMFSREELHAAKDRLASMRESGVDTDQYLKSMQAEDMSDLSARFRKEPDRVYDIRAIESGGGRSDAMERAEAMLTEQHELIKGLDARISRVSDDSAQGDRSLKREMEERSELDHLHERLDDIKNNEGAKRQLNEQDIEKLSEEITKNQRRRRVSRDET